MAALLSLYFDMTLLCERYMAVCIVLSFSVSDIFGNSVVVFFVRFLGP